jgi:hypothetical protein
VTTSKTSQATTEDPAITAARITSAITYKSAVVVAVIGLVGTVFTGGVTLAGQTDDKPPSSRTCSISAADTATAIDAYDRMLREGKLTINQSESLKVDAIEDQVADAVASDCPG